MSVREPSASYADAAELLRSLGIRFAKAGALAAEEYRSRRRLTTDADLLVASAQGIVEAMEARGYQVRAMTQPGERDPYLVLVRGLGDAIDFIVAETDYQREALDRAVDEVLTVEDVIVHKLLAWRPKDRDDIASILEVGHELDEAYIERWAEAWEVTDRWAEAKTWL